MKERIYAIEMHSTPEYMSRKFKYVPLSSMQEIRAESHQVSEYSFWHFRCLLFDPGAMLLEDKEIDAE